MDFGTANHSQKQGLKWCLVCGRSFRGGSKPFSRRAVLLGPFGDSPTNLNHAVGVWCDGVTARPVVGVPYTP